MYNRNKMVASRIRLGCKSRKCKRFLLIKNESFTVKRKQTSGSVTADDVVLNALFEIKKCNGITNVQFLRTYNCITGWLPKSVLEKLPSYVSIRYYCTQTKNRVIILEF